MSKSKNKQNKVVDKIIDFGRQLFAGVIRSRTGSLCEIAKIMRFQKGTKGFERMYHKLSPFIAHISKVYRKAILKNLPKEGLRLGIFDDTNIKKTGKKFPKLQIHHDHADDSFFSGMKVLSSTIYQNGKTATVDSIIVGKEDNKLEVAKKKVDVFIADFLVDVFLFDAWYCKDPLIQHIQNKNKLFVSRARRDTKVVFGLEDVEEQRLDALFKGFSHKEFEQVKIHGKSYWVADVTFQLKSYGELRIIISKEGQHDEPIFLVTNAFNFSAKFIVSLYLKRFSIEVFFKDAKQYLNFETFLCRKEVMWDLHLLLTNVLHWSIQKRNSISKTIRNIRESVDKCLLFINQNVLINKFFDAFKKRCPT